MGKLNKTTVKEWIVKSVIYFGGEQLFCIYILFKSFCLYFCIQQIFTIIILPSFLFFRFLMYCAILWISFGGTGPRLRRSQVAQPSSYCLLAEIFRSFLCCKTNAKRSLYSPRYHVIIILIINQLTWHSGKVTFG